MTTRMDSLAAMAVRSASSAASSSATASVRASRTTSRYLADSPNGGVVYLQGNLFQKGPNADNGIAIAYGQEGLNKPVNTFEIVHNTVVMTRSGGTFVVAPNGTQYVKLTANLFAGTGNPTLFSGGFAAGSVVQQGNLTSSASNIAAPDRTSLRRTSGPTPHFRRKLACRR